MSEETVAVAGMEVAMPDVAISKYATEENFDALAKTNDYLARLQLYGASSGPVKKELVSMGCFGYVKNKDIVDLGKEVRCWVLGYRPKAMRLGTKKVEAYFNPGHPEFAKIKEESKIKDSQSLCGPEFLLYLAERNLFVTFFMANKTMRREAPNVKEYIPRAKGKKGLDDPGKPATPMTLRSTLIETDEYSWHGPVSSGCSFPIPMPPAEELASVLMSFNNPPEMEKQEVATEAETAATSRAR